MDFDRHWAKSVSLLSFHEPTGCFTIGHSSEETPAWQMFYSAVACLGAFIAVATPRKERQAMHKEPEENRIFHMAVTAQKMHCRGNMLRWVVFMKAWTFFGYGKSAKHVQRLAKVSYLPSAGNMFLTIELDYFVLICAMLRSQFVCLQLILTQHVYSSLRGFIVRFMIYETVKAGQRCSFVRFCG